MLKKLFDAEPVLLRGAVLIVFMLAAWLGLPIPAKWADAINVVALGIYLFITRLKVTPNASVVVSTADLPQPKPSVAAPSAQTIGATAMPDFGNWFDATFKTPLLTLEHDGEEWLTDDAKNLIGQAKADAQVAETAAVTAAASQAAALSAAVKPHLDSAVDAIADKVPLVGGLIKGEAEATANSASDAFFGALASWAQSMLAPKPAA